MKTVQKVCIKNTHSRQ